MTEDDRPLQDPTAALTPAQSEAVRRLLAGARDDQGIPDDVATRLDAVLADLSAARAAAPPDPDVIPLRRRWPKVLVAAAAVTLFGFGAAQLVGNGASEDDADSAGVTAEQDPGDVAEPGAEVGGPDAPAAPAPSDDSAVRGGLDGVQLLTQSSLNGIGIQGLRQLDSDTLDRDLRDLTRTAAPTTAEGESYSNYDVRAAKVRCGPFYTVSGGEIFAALYRRHLALVLFHPRLDGVRLVEIYDCESANPRRAIRTVTVQTGE